MDSSPVFNGEGVAVENSGEPNSSSAAAEAVKPFTSNILDRLQRDADLHRQIDEMLEPLRATPGRVPSVAIVRVPPFYDTSSDIRSLWRALKQDPTVVEDDLVDVVVMASFDPHSPEAMMNQHAGGHIGAGAMRAVASVGIPDMATAGGLSWNPSASPLSHDGQGGNLDRTAATTATTGPLAAMTHTSGGPVNAPMRTTTVPPARARLGDGPLPTLSLGGTAVSSSPPSPGFMSPVYLPGCVAGSFRDHPRGDSDTSSGDSRDAELTACRTTRAITFQVVPAYVYYAHLARCCVLQEKDNEIFTRLPAVLHHLQQCHAARQPLSYQLPSERGDGGCGPSFTGSPVDPPCPLRSAASSLPPQPLQVKQQPTLVVAATAAEAAKVVCPSDSPVMAAEDSNPLALSPALPRNMGFPDALPSPCQRATRTGAMESREGEHVHSNGHLGTAASLLPPLPVFFATFPATPPSPSASQASLRNVLRQISGTVARTLRSPTSILLSPFSRSAGGAGSSSTGRRFTSTTEEGLDDSAIDTGGGVVPLCMTPSANGTGTTAMQGGASLRSSVAVGGNASARLGTSGVQPLGPRSPMSLGVGGGGGPSSSLPPSVLPRATNAGGGPIAGGDTGGRQASRGARQVIFTVRAAAHIASLQPPEPREGKDHDRVPCTSMNTAERHGGGDGLLQSRTPAPRREGDASTSSSDGAAPRDSRKHSDESAVGLPFERPAALAVQVHSGAETASPTSLPRSQLHVSMTTSAATPQPPLQELQPHEGASASLNRRQKNSPSSEQYKSPAARKASTVYSLSLEQLTAPLHDASPTPQLSVADFAAAAPQRQQQRLVSLQQKQVRRYTDAVRGQSSPLLHAPQSPPPPHPNDIQRQRFAISLLKVTDRSQKVLESLEGLLVRVREHWRGAFQDVFVAIAELDRQSQQVDVAAGQRSPFSREPLQPTVAERFFRDALLPQLISSLERREEMREALMEELAATCFDICEIPLPDPRVYRYVPAAVPRHIAAHARGFPLQRTFAEEILYQQRVLQSILIAMEEHQHRRQIRRERRRRLRLQARMERRRRRRPLALPPPLRRAWRSLRKLAGTDDESPSGDGSVAGHDAVAPVAAGAGGDGGIICGGAPGVSLEDFACTSRDSHLHSVDSTSNNEESSNGDDVSGSPRCIQTAAARERVSSPAMPTPLSRRHTGPPVADTSRFQVPSLPLLTQDEGRSNSGGVNSMGVVGRGLRAARASSRGLAALEEEAVGAGAHRDGSSLTTGERRKGEEPHLYQTSRGGSFQASPRQRSHMIAVANGGSDSGSGNGIRFVNVGPTTATDEAGRRGLWLETITSTNHARGGEAAVSGSVGSNAGHSANTLSLVTPIPSGAQLQPQTMMDTPPLHSIGFGDGRAEGRQPGTPLTGSPAAPSGFSVMNTTAATDGEAPVPLLHSSQQQQHQSRPHRGGAATFSFDSMLGAGLVSGTLSPIAGPTLDQACHAAGANFHGNSSGTAASFNPHSSSDATGVGAVVGLASLVPHHSPTGGSRSSITGASWASYIPAAPCNSMYGTYDAYYGHTIAAPQAVLLRQQALQEVSAANRRKTERRRRSSARVLLAAAAKAGTSGHRRSTADPGQRGSLAGSHVLGEHPPEPGGVGGHTTAGSAFPDVPMTHYQRLRRTASLDSTAIVVAISQRVGPPNAGLSEKMSWRTVGAGGGVGGIAPGGSNPLEGFCPGSASSSLSNTPFPPVAASSLTGYVSRAIGASTSRGITGDNIYASGDDGCASSGGRALHAGGGVGLSGGEGGCGLGSVASLAGGPTPLSRYSHNLFDLLGTYGGPMYSGITYYYTFGDAQACLFNASMQPRPERTEVWERLPDPPAAGTVAAKTATGSPSPGSAGAAMSEESLAARAPTKTVSSFSTVSGSAGKTDGGAAAEDYLPVARPLQRGGSSAADFADRVEGAAAAAVRSVLAEPVDEGCSYFYASPEAEDEGTKEEARRAEGRERRNTAFYSLFHHLHRTFFCTVLRPAAVPRPQGGNSGGSTATTSSAAPPPLSSFVSPYAAMAGGPPSGGALGGGHMSSRRKQANGSLMVRLRRFLWSLLRLRTESITIDAGDFEDGSDAAAAAAAVAAADASSVSFAARMRQRDKLNTRNGNFGLTPLEVWLACRYSRKIAAEVYIMDVNEQKGDPFFPAVRVVDEIVAHAVLYYHNRSLRDFLDELNTQFNLVYEPKTEWGRYRLGYDCDSTSPSRSSTPTVRSPSGSLRTSEIEATRRAQQQQEQQQLHMGSCREAASAHTRDNSPTMRTEPLTRRIQEHPHHQLPPMPLKHQQLHGRAFSRMGPTGTSPGSSTPLIDLALTESPMVMDLLQDVASPNGAPSTANGMIPAQQQRQNPLKAQSSRVEGDVDANGKPIPRGTTGDDCLDTSVYYLGIVDQQEDEIFFLSVENCLVSDAGKRLPTTLTREEELEERLMMAELRYVRDFLLEHRNVLSSASLTPAGSNRLEGVFGAPATVFPFLQCARESVSAVQCMFDSLEKHYGMLTYEAFARYAQDVFGRDHPEIVRHAPRIFRTLNKSRCGHVTFEELCSWMGRKLSCGSNQKPDAHLLATTMSLRLPLTFVLDCKQEWATTMSCTLHSLSDGDDY